MPPQPATIGRYRIVERIALGGMAELYKATIDGAHDFHKTVVIKKILPHLAADAEFVQMFIDEAKILSHLQHPRIVQVIELESSGDQLFIAMEYVRGIDLLKLLRNHSQTRRPVPPQLAVHIVFDVLDALDYAHQAMDDSGRLLGIVHRDISPANILLSRGGIVKLTDFGIARVAAYAHQQTQSGSLKGKYSYMSPEQVISADLDGRSDLFAVGVVLAEILMCRRLFVAPSDLDVLMMVREVELDRLDKHGGSIDPGLMTIVRRALEREREDRYQTASAFRDALGDWLFEQHHRVTSDDLAQLVRNVVEPGDVTADEFAVAQTATLSGETTQREQVEAVRAAIRARESLIERDADSGVRYAAEIGRLNLVRRTVTAPPMIGETFAMALAVPAGERPDREGSFAEISPIRAIYELAIDGATGLLVARRGSLVKQVYFVSGEGQFVDSNVASERLGAFLVGRNLITSEDLETALSVLDQFGGRLGDALIGLGMMSPMRALHWQSEQVREKLIDVAAWRDGSYRWYQGVRHDGRAPVLHLDPYDLLGAAAQRLDVDHLRRWAEQRADRIPHPVANPKLDPTQFRLGAAPARLLELLDDRTLVQVTSSLPTKEQRLEALRLLYLLIQTDLVAL